MADKTIGELYTANGGVPADSDRIEREDAAGTQAGASTVDELAQATAFSSRFAPITGGNYIAASALPDWVAVNLGAPETAIDTTGAIAGALWFPPWAITVTAVYLFVGSATTTGTLTLDINEAGSTILSTKLTIDATETASLTAAAAAVISDASIAAGAKVSFDWDGVGDGTATDAIVVIEFTRDVS